MLVIAFRPKGAPEDGSGDFYIGETYSFTGTGSRTPPRRWVTTLSLARIFDEAHTACRLYRDLLAEANGQAPLPRNAVGLPTREGTILVRPLRLDTPMAGIAVTWTHDSQPVYEQQGSK